MYQSWILQQVRLSCYVLDCDLGFLFHHSFLTLSLKVAAFVALVFLSEVWSAAK